MKYLVQEDIRWQFEENNASRHHIGPRIDLIGVDAKVFGDCRSQGISNVGTIYLQGEECKAENWEQSEVEPEFESV
jgi:hypothetical protein